MTQYYYLVASLPLLFFDEPPPFSSRTWLGLCREQVNERDYALLARISFQALRSRPDDHALWRSYAAWETALRNEMTLQRAQRLGIVPDPFLRQAPFFSDLSILVKETLGAGTPLAVENALERRRWSMLEELETATGFDLGRLIIYRLKLLLLERKNNFRPEPGREAFAQEYTRILDIAATWMSPSSPLLGTEKRND